MWLLSALLEVKNIVNREITGIPKMEYWIQMQIQMEVCDLKECDFLETRFVEYEDFDTFEKDGDFNETEDNKIKGIIMYFIKDGQPYYEYAPIGISKLEFEIWETKIMKKNHDLSWMKNIYWKLNQISCVLVLRNKFWFNAAKPILQDIWGIIEKEKISGYNHRAPKRNIKNKITNSPDTSKSSKCYININTLLNNEPSEKKTVVYTPSKTVNENIVIKINTECLSDTSPSLSILMNQAQDTNSDS